jgi:PAS domain-containing protein
LDTQRSEQLLDEALAANVALLTEDRKLELLVELRREPLPPVRAGVAHVLPLVPMPAGAIRWRAAPDGANVYADPQWATLTGSRADGWSWAQSIHADDLPRVAIAWGLALAHGYCFAAQFRLRVASGEYVPCRSVALSIKNAAGEVVSWTGFVVPGSALQRDSRAAG